MHAGFHKIAVITTLVALLVIGLGAFVRLSDAGLGCPDWPGCYGQVTWPQDADEVTTANQSYPERPVEQDKAWKEMVHRYLAGGLGLLIGLLGFLAVRGQRGPILTLLLAMAATGIAMSVYRSGSAYLALGLALSSITLLLLQCFNRRLRGWQKVAILSIAVVIVQAMLGMWTVTLKLKPVIVMAHLLGGMLTFSLLLWLSLRSQNRPRTAISNKYQPMIIFGLTVLALQIALGGWTSANYAALACPDFPTCLGQWWPQTDFAEGFVLWREVGVDYEGGILDLPARAAIHLSHRIGAIVTFLALFIISLRLMRLELFRTPAQLLLLALVAQISLGVLNVMLHLPLTNAVAHNVTAALLLGTLIWLLHRARPAH